MTTPKQLVEAFIEDFFAWNSKVYAMSEQEKDNSGNAMQEASRLYGDLILKRYCRPNFKGQPIAFGSTSCHEPGKEIIVADQTTETTALVKTRHTGSYDFVSDYEYSFIKTDGQWFLESVDYVDEDGKYPGL